MWWEEGGAKLWRSMIEGGMGVQKRPKKYDIINEQPLELNNINILDCINDLLIAWMHIFPQGKTQHCTEGDKQFNIIAHGINMQ